jgi:F-type H+-transporting ATPase subunit epsilon
MAETFELQIITPERVLFAQPVHMAEIPGAEGNFAVLPRHAPLISGLRPGLVRIKKSEKDTIEVFLSGGFAEIANNTCIILADYATSKEEIKRDFLLSRIEKIKNDLSYGGADETILERELKTCEAMLVFAK